MVTNSKLRSVAIVPRDNSAEPLFPFDFALIGRSEINIKNVVININSLMRPLVKPTGQCLGYWNNPEDAIRFNISDLGKGTYEVMVKHAAPDEHGGELAIKLNDLVIEQRFGATGNWNAHNDQSLGYFEHNGGSVAVTLSILKQNIENIAVMNFFSMTFEEK
jgi:hypothetical protein